MQDSTPYTDSFDVTGASSCVADSGLHVLSDGAVSDNNGIGHLSHAHYTCSAHPPSDCNVDGVSIASLPLRRHKPHTFRLALGGPTAGPDGLSASLKRLGCGANWMAAPLALLASSSYDSAAEFDVTHAAGRRSSVVNGGSAFEVSDTSVIKVHGTAASGDLYSAGAFVVGLKSGTGATI